MAETAQWYVIHTYSGYENKVATSIEKVVDLRGMHDLIREVKIPMEKVQDIKESGEVVETERKLLPGYVLVNMVVNDDTWGVAPQYPRRDRFCRPGRKTHSSDR